MTEAQLVTVEVSVEMKAQAEGKAAMAEKLTTLGYQKFRALLFIKTIFATLNPTVVIR